MSFGGGFSVLAWVKETSYLIESMPTDREKTDMIRQLLGDFNTLLGMRWTMEMTIVTLDGTLYAFGNNTRISVSDKTIRNAIGELNEHIEFLRGSSHTSAEDLARYKVCKQKWKVPEQVTDTSYGWEATARQETSHTTKRPRTSF